MREIVWSRSFDRSATDILRIQQEIATTIVTRLRGQVAVTALPADPHPANDPEAYDLYLRGRYAWHQRTESGLREAVNHFADAVARAPRYARAVAGLGDACAVLGFYDYLPPRDVFPKARKAAAQAAVFACDRPTSPTASAAHAHGSSTAAATIDDATEGQLRSLKQATAPFRDFAVAQYAGYTTRVTGCYQNPLWGTMGFHYGDATRFNATLDVTRPEVLLYERQPDKSMQLVGVEYIVPFTAWSDPNPPTLLGQTFVRNLSFNVWALHAWVWRANPRGIFSDWNPNVHC